METTTRHFRFREGDEILTLWVEKTVYESGWESHYFVGWCPERKNNLIVPSQNVVLMGPSEDES